MIKIGLTGNIGSGKTTVSKIFESLGIPVFYADTEAKKLYEKAEVIKILQSLFGNIIFNKSGNIDLKLLANVVFKNKSKLNKLTSILHPLVFNEYQKWIIENSSAIYTIHESAIIFEYSQQKKYDKIICVSSPVELRINRVLKRDKISINKVKERINNQILESEKIKLSDYLIHNDENSFLIPQVLEIHKKLIVN